MLIKGKSKYYGECFYHGGEIWTKRLTTDHIIPKALGGTNHETNKVKCCQECNYLKANHLPRHLAEIIEAVYIPRANDPARIEYLQKIRLKCLDLELNHIPKHKDLMIKQPHQLQ